MFSNFEENLYNKDNFNNFIKLYSSMYNNNEFKEILKKNYKNIDKIDNIDNIDKIDNIDNIDKIDNIDIELIKQKYIMAKNNIPEMLFITNLINFNGKINEKNIKIVIDTGATSCFIFKSAVDKYNLRNLIDTSTSVIIQYIQEMNSTIGTIWFLEIDLLIENNKWITVPINVEVIDDSIINKNISHDFELILGMNFLKSYKANIDFSSMKITLNNNIKINFKM